MTATALLLAILAAAQDRLVHAEPSDAGMSAAVLERGVHLFEDAISRDELRGVVLLVARRGKIVLHRPLGWRNREAAILMERDTLFRMASNTKAVVAAAVLMLAEEGKLDLRDPIGKHLPAFDNAKYRDITVHHLLTHTSGLRIKTLFLSPLMKKSAQHPDAPTLRLEVNRYAGVGPKAKPGTTFSYNNPGYNTLGALIETLSGKPLETFLTGRIYRPLGMNDTSNHPVPDRFDRMSVVYRRKDSRWSIAFRQDSGMKVPLVRASGGMVSTALDFANFCQMFLNGGDPILGEASVKAARTQQAKSAFSSKELAKRKSVYGYGWFVANDGVFSHGGSEGTFAWVDPDRKLIGLVLTQSPGAKIPRAAFQKLVNEACGSD